ncbi:MAM domain-containing glycosylphosphatidylinositol anchor protein 2-like [Diadema antillarum]|uniref:MAM domain-containing glycosylphosphatidylinositol anchor protein 2-like n=1 Tax=Diadema antillarum TaxID=105358 RepID=UPI003A850097
MASTLPALLLLMTVAQCWGYNTTQGPNNFDCDFEYGTCGWQQSYYDDFDWSLNSGGTSSSSTGPSGDHTTGNGYYMYIETSSPRYSGQVARLTSPAQYRYGPQCLTFWYHMYGSTINSLNVYKSASSTTSGGEVSFSHMGQIGNVWNETQVTIDNYTQPFYITFEGVCGSSYTGDIAIDDIALSQGSCEQDYSTSSWYQTTQDPGDFNCDFESGLCGWQQAYYGDDFDWTRYSGSTSSYNTGPSVDHTLGTSCKQFDLAFM